MICVLIIYTPTSKPNNVCLILTHLFKETKVGKLNFTSVCRLYIPPSSLLPPLPSSLLPPPSSLLPPHSSLLTPHYSLLTTPPSSSRPLHGRRTSPPPLATAASSTQLQLWRQTTTTTTWSPHGPCELGQRMPTIVTTTLGGHVHPPPKMMPTAATALVDLVERTKSSLVKMGRIRPCRPYILPQ